MIFGRPTNLWLGAITAVLNAVVVILAALVPPIIIPAIVVGVLNLAVAALIALIANQPPVINSGDPVKVITPVGQDNKMVTIH